MSLPFSLPGVWLLPFLVSTKEMEKTHPSGREANLLTSRYIQVRGWGTNRWIEQPVTVFSFLLPFYEAQRPNPTSCGRKSLGCHQKPLREFGSLGACSPLSFLFLGPRNSSASPQACGSQGLSSLSRRYRRQAITSGVTPPSPLHVCG